MTHMGSVAISLYCIILAVLYNANYLAKSWLEITSESPPPGEHEAPSVP